MSALKELMARYCEGDALAFRELYALVAPRLYGYLVKMTRQQALAADVLQQTFLKIHRARGAYLRDADPLPWMFAIAHRTFLDEMRRRRREEARDSASAPSAATADLHGERHDVGAEPTNPVLVRRAFDALEALPSRQRQAVVLTKLQGKSVAEAAAIAGTTEGAMRVRVHRGCAMLRALLERFEATAVGARGELDDRARA